MELNKKLVNFESMNENTKLTLAEALLYTKGLAGGYGGDFPLSTASKDSIYRVPATNKFYVCTENYNGSQISAPNSNFVELSVWKNHDRLNNLKYIPCQLGDFRGGYIKYNNFIVVSGKLYIQKQEVNKTYYFNFPLNKTYNDIISATTEAIRDIELPEYQLKTIIGNTQTAITIKDTERNQEFGFTLFINAIFNN